MDITRAMLEEWTERIGYRRPLLSRHLAKRFPDGTTLEELYSILSDPEDPYGDLRIALFALSLDAAKELVANGVDVNASTPQGETPLSIAARVGDAELAEWLIARGADVSVESGTGLSALHAATYGGHRDVADVLLSHGVEPDLYVAAGMGMTETLAELLVTLRPPDPDDVAWLTDPLHVAARNGQDEAMQMLLAAGADVNAKSDNGLTALLEAASHGHVETARTLLAAGAEVDATEDARCTSLHFAAERGDETMARLLLDAGADPNARNFSGGTPLHAAMFFGSVRVAEMLVDSGADPALRDDQGETPLDKAAAR